MSERRRSRGTASVIRWPSNPRAPSSSECITGQVVRDDCFDIHTERRLRERSGSWDVPFMARINCQSPHHPEIPNGAYEAV